MSAVNQTSFFHPKNVRFLILNWHGQLTRTEQLIDCSLISVQPIKNKIFDSAAQLPGIGMPNYCLGRRNQEVSKSK